MNSPSSVIDADPPRSGLADRHFVRHLENAVAEAGGTIAWHADHWLAEIRRDADRALVLGYAFPVNNVVAAKIADDKAASSTIMRAAGVSCLHQSLWRPTWRGNRPVDWPGELPVVLKPNAESGGRDVHRVRTEGELEDLVSALSERYRALAWSRLVEVEDEFRAVLLDGELLLAYRKVRAPDSQEWRHNLHFGAVPEVCVAPLTTERLATLGRSAMDALSLRFATVDIVTVEGDFLVLEVNSGVSLERFSHHSEENFQLAGGVYAEAIRACFA
ncbi:RimK family alpha-L-glutamate ligase [Amycolatopsis sp. NPDC049868]|uniref:RimK family alpha-L-glutamate ligase n=1 Tax=Amycolatopsis sp. NPDC049868 TaxID=3363934 RepID=UPI0037AD3D68